MYKMGRDFPHSVDIFYICFRGMQSSIFVAGPKSGQIGRIVTRRASGVKLGG